MGLARIGLDLGRLFQIIESAERIALQGKDPAAQQIGAVVIGS